MEIRVGQWVRVDDIIFQWKDNSHNFKSDKYKVANTPQELVREGDLGLIKEWQTIETIHTWIGEHYCYMDGKRHFIGRYITLEKIYTPNKDKTQYTEQWRKK